MSDEDRLLSWLEENYKSLILGLLIGLSILYGYKTYISDRNLSQLVLSREYDIAITAYKNGENDPILEYSRKNIINYPKNIYTNLSNLYSAKIMYEQNKFNDAYTYLDHIIEKSEDIDIKNIAIYRKSKILIDDGKYKEAHSILDNSENYQHIELKGDLYVLEGDYVSAIKNYKDVLTFSITPNERKNLIAKINLIK
tara:strand:- start:1281 stop:1871 length:591 start_codon:yes stop_codon:yes gene_type:complete